MPDWPGNIPRNAFKQALSRCERQVGLWCSMASPVAAEILAGAGFDWIVIDGEHAPNDIVTLLPQLQAMRGGTAEPVFRVPWNEPVIIKRALDVGARSVAPRANDYGRIQSYHRNAHLDTCVLVQLETKIALKEVEAVAAVEGVDGIFIGPSDLAAAFGHLGNPKHPEVQAAIADAAQRIRAKGKSAGILTGNADDAEGLFDAGYNFVAVGSDVGVLARTAEALAARFRKK